MPGQLRPARRTAARRAGLAPLSRNGYMSRCHGESRMLALILTIDLALRIYGWIIIGAAIFSWLYAFNVVNPRNEFVGMIGNMLFRMTDPALQPIRRYLP